MDIIRDAIKCSLCKRVLEAPVLLQCGNCICQKHTKGQESAYECQLCTGVHRAPEGGFCVIKAFEKIIQTNIEKIKLNKEYHEAMESCKKLTFSVEELDRVIARPELFITTMIDNLKSDIELIRDEYKVFIDTSAREFTSELEEYASQCIDHLDTHEHITHSEQLTKACAKVKKELEKWQVNLNNFESELNEWRGIRERCDRAVADVKVKLSQHKCELLLKKFKDYQLKLFEFNKVDFKLDKK